MSRTCLRHCCTVSAFLLALLCAGCAFFTEGDYPDVRRASPERLHSIPTLDMAAMAGGEGPGLDVPALGAPLPEREPAAEARLTLEECRADALRNNLLLQVQLINPSIAREAVVEQEARFEPSLFADARYSRSETLLNPPDDRSVTRTFSGTAGVDLPLRTGGSIQIGLPVGRGSTSGPGPDTTMYSGGATASVYQPLLRGGGVQANTHAIRIAHYEWQIVSARTRLEITRVLAAVDRVYWRLHATRQELQVRKDEYDLAVAQLMRARRMVAVGAVPEVEIIRAESGVADRVEAVIVADNAVRDRERELKRVLNRTDLPVQGDTVIIPASLPDAVQHRLDLEKLTDAAMESRMDMLEVELRLAQDASNIDFAKNDTLPFLAVDYTYGVSGVGSTAGDAHDLLFDRPLQDHSVGVNLSVPLGNGAARARLRSALYAKARNLASRDRQRLVIEEEVAAALDKLESTWHRVVASRRRTILARRNLEAENRQFGLGLRTSTDVLDAQTSLGDARSAELRAVAEYQIAKVDIAFATGMLLGEAGVVWAPIVPAADR